MTNSLPPICGGCEKRDDCRADKPPVPGEVSGGRLVGLAAAVFLLPLVAAIAAAAIAGPVHGPVAGSAALVVSLAAVAVIGMLARRRAHRL